MIPTFQPKIEVRLIKTARRGTLATGLAAASRYQEFTGIDLTPYLVAGEPVSVRQWIGGGAGTWSLSLADQMMPEYAETLYAMIEPMDMVEIRIARAPHEYQGKPPVVMRGFVSGVDRSREMTGGVLHRRVHLSGHDYGKILEILRIYYLNNSAIGDNILGGLGFFQKYAGLDSARIMSAKDFAALVLDVLINPFIAHLTIDADGAKVGTAVMHQLMPEVSIEGTVSPLSVSLFADGSVQQFLTQFLDIGAFNEMFVDDRDTESVLVVRPNLFLDLNNKPIQGSAPAASPDEKAKKLADLKAQADEADKAFKAEYALVMADLNKNFEYAKAMNDAKAAGDDAAFNEAGTSRRAVLKSAGVHIETSKQLLAKRTALLEQIKALESNAPNLPFPVIQLKDDEIVMITEGRSDAGVANYYWVNNVGWQFQEQITVSQLAAAGSVEQYALFDYVNTNPARFGFRKIEVSSALGPNDQTYGDAQKSAQAASETDKRIKWLSERRRILAEQNKDNAVLESGTMVIRGNERIRRGMYLLATFGDVPSLYYTVSVTHQITPLGMFTTTVNFERGTGFAVRAQRTEAAYLAELNLKGTA